MKIVRFSLIAALSTLCYCSMQSSALAEPQALASSELRGIEKVFGLISNVNLTQTDQKSNQFILDILDTKSEIDGLKGAQSGMKAPVVSSGSTPTPGSKAKVLPPSRRSNKAF